MMSPMTRIIYPIVSLARSVMEKDIWVLHEKQNAENPDARQVTVSGVKMTAAQFFMQNFQKILESLKK